MDASPLDRGRSLSVSPVTPPQPDKAPPTLRPEPVAPSPQRPRWGIPVLLVCIGALIGITIWNVTNTASTPAETGGVMTVPTAEATIGTFERKLRVGGTIGAARFAAIRAPRMRGSRDTNRRNLTLTNMVEGGTIVQAGDVVAEFEMRWLEDHIDDRRSEVVQARSDVDKRRAEIMIEKETQRQALKAAQAEWEKAKLDLRTAEVRSEIEADLLELAVQETKAAADQLEHETDLQAVSHEAEIRSMELEVGSEQNHLERHLRDWERMKLTTPVGGLAVIETIYRGNGQFGQVQAGDDVYPGAFFLRVVDLSEMVLNANVNQVDIQSIRMGQKCEVRLDAYPNLTLPGHIASIGALATSGGNSRFRRRGRDDYVKLVTVKVAIDEPDERVIPDLSGSADVILERQEDTLLVPRSAVQRRDDETFVYVRQGERFIERKVEVSQMNPVQAVVTSGLNEGEEVALRTPASMLLPAGS